MSRFSSQSTPPFPHVETEVEFHGESEATVRLDEMGAAGAEDTLRML